MVTPRGRTSLADVALQGESRWSKRAAKWNPELTNTRISKQQGRTKKRWQDDVENVLQISFHSDNTNWVEVAAKATLWKNSEALYVKGLNTDN